MKSESGVTEKTPGNSNTWTLSCRLLMHRNRTFKFSRTLILLKKILKASTTCNSCDFASIQAGDLRRHVKTNIWENHTHANIVTLHLFKHAIWEDTWKLTPEKITRIWEKHTHATIMTLHLFNHATWEDFWNHLIAKFGISATIVTLHLYKQTIWEDIWKLTFEKTTHMELLWLYICSNRQFEKTCEN